MQINIVFLDGITVNPGDFSWEGFHNFGDFTVYDRTSSLDVIERSKNADVLIVNKVKLNAEHFSQLPKLRLICVAATGYDVIDIQAAKEYGITVCNVVGYSTYSVAQMALSLLLEATNQVGLYSSLNQKGVWSNSLDFCYWNSPLIELAGKKVGIVGLGNIGKCLAEILHALGAELFAVTSKSANEIPTYITPISLTEAFRTLDIISLNCPLTENNKQFVNKELLQQCKKGLILVNTARGLLINDDAVSEFLHTGQLGAYCTDVLSQEPPSHNNPLLSAPNCYITPHIAWATVAARKRIIQTLISNIEAYLSGNPQNIVTK